jgi:hypothetical protein
VFDKTAINFNPLVFDQQSSVGGPHALGCSGDHGDFAVHTFAQDFSHLKFYRLSELCEGFI